MFVYTYIYKGANIGMWHLVSRSHTRKPYLFAEFCALLPTTPLSLARDTPHLFRSHGQQAFILIRRLQHSDKESNPPPPNRKKKRIDIDTSACLQVVPSPSRISLRMYV